MSRQCTSLMYSINTSSAANAFATVLPTTHHLPIAHHETVKQLAVPNPTQHQSPCLPAFTLYSAIHSSIGIANEYHNILPETCGKSSWQCPPHRCKGCSWQHFIHTRADWCITVFHDYPALADPVLLQTSSANEEKIDQLKQRVDRLCNDVLIPMSSADKDIALPSDIMDFITHVEFQRFHLHL